MSGGRHETDPESLSAWLLHTGPMKRIRGEDPEKTLPDVNEAKRPAWPVAVILGLVLATAVGITYTVGSLAAEENPASSPSAVSDSYSPEPDPPPTATATPTHSKARPVPTVTKTIMPVPRPAVTRTIMVTPPAKIVTKPGPTVTRRITPKAAPAVTETRHIDRCFSVRDDMIEDEIDCP